MPSTSRWLVGSSSTSRSACCTSAAASATRRRSPPDSRSTGASSPSVGQPEAGEHLADAASPAHSCSAASPTTTSRTVAPGRQRRPRWATAAICDAAGAGHPAGVRRLGADDQTQQRRLAAAVAPDDADPLAVGDAERHAVQDGRRAVRLADRFEVDRGSRGIDVPSADDPGAGDRTADDPGRAAQVAGGECGGDALGVRRRPRRGTRRSGPTRTRSRPARRVPAGGQGRRAARGRSDDGGGLQIVGQRVRRGPSGHRPRSASSSPSAGCGLGRRRARGRSSSPYAAGVEIPKSAKRAPTMQRRRSPAPGRAPRPVRCPSAVPPSRQNATSLPSSAASAPSSARDVPVRHSSAHATRAAAASAEPPAIPPATGMHLLISKRDVRRRPGRARPAATRPARPGSPSSAGTSPASGPVTEISRPWAGAGHHLVVAGRRRGRPSAARGTRRRAGHRRPDAGSPSPARGPEPWPSRARGLGPRFDSNGRGDRAAPSAGVRRRSDSPVV